MHKLINILIILVGIIKNNIYKTVKETGKPLKIYDCGVVLY